jgi:hypothetical protein
MNLNKIILIATIMLLATPTTTLSQQAPPKKRPATPQPKSRAAKAAKPKKSDIPPVKRGDHRPSRKASIGTFKLKWVYKNFPLELKAADLPLSWQRRVGETKVVSDMSEINTRGPLRDGIVKVPNGGSAVMVLYVHNTTAETQSFVVSPHHVHPSKASLGFQFKCLCYGHTYTVPPGKYWYRIAKLSPYDYNTTDPVDLSHEVIKVPNPPGKK